jgi:hypothetical protein
MKFSWELNKGVAHNVTFVNKSKSDESDLIEEFQRRAKKKIEVTRSIWKIESISDAKAG